MDTDVLHAFDVQIRRSLAAPAPGWVVEDLGRLVRTTGPAASRVGAFVEWADLDGLAGDEVDAVIAEQVAYFRSLAGGGTAPGSTAPGSTAPGDTSSDTSSHKASEWKHYDYDRPADLSDRLVRAGLTREAPEALIIGETESVLTRSSAGGAIAGVRVRRITDPAEMSRLAELHGLVWSEDHAWLVEEMRAEIAARPDDTQIFFAEDDSTGALMGAAWIRFTPGTDFAGLWGGSTHPDHRRRGAYRALVRVRAQLAAERGVRYLQVDATPDSEPILTRLGLRRLATTTPHTLTTK